MLFLTLPQLKMEYINMGISFNKHRTNFDITSRISMLTIILVINSYLLQCVHGVSVAKSENNDRHIRNLNIKTLPPDPSYSDGYRHEHGEYYASEVIHSADALLSDWDGDHWASLDPEQDRVNLQWSSTSDEISFQVSNFKIIMTIFNGRKRFI